jgi:hypothetical protein
MPKWHRRACRATNPKRARCCEMASEGQLCSRECLRGRFENAHSPRMQCMCMPPGMHACTDCKHRVGCTDLRAGGFAVCVWVEPVPRRLLPGPLARCVGGDSLESRWFFTRGSVIDQARQARNRHQQPHIQYSPCIHSLSSSLYSTHILRHSSAAHLLTNITHVVPAAIIRPQRGWTMQLVVL